MDRGGRSKGRGRGDQREMLHLYRSGEGRGDQRERRGGRGREIKGKGLHQGVRSKEFGDQRVRGQSSKKG